MKESQLITIQELQECPEFAHLDEVHAQGVIDSISELCCIISSQYQNLSKQEPNEN